MAKKRIGKWEFTEEEIQEQIEKAKKRGKRSAELTPHAVRASFNKKTAHIIVELSNDCVFSFPVRLIKELRNASPAQIADLKITPQGTALHWDSLDAQYSVAGLLGGIFGTKAWMSEIGKLGGQATSIAKAEAARLNGQKGGRPKIAALRAPKAKLS